MAKSKQAQRAVLDKIKRPTRRKTHKIDPKKKREPTPEPPQKVKLTTTLDADARALLRLLYATTGNAQGDILSRLIRDEAGRLGVTL